MQQIKWFDRKFDFTYTQNIFPAIIERLAGTPIRLQAKVSPLTRSTLTFKPAGKWSINEHLGHLLDLESLWQGRLADILNQEKYLRATDLDNSQIEAAQYNDYSINELLEQFTKAREATVATLSKLGEEEVYRSASHPRLHQPMRTMDLFLFVAEHDDHHLAQMTNITSNS